MYSGSAGPRSPRKLRSRPVCLRPCAGSSAEEEGWGGAVCAMWLPQPCRFSNLSFVIQQH